MYYYLLITLIGFILSLLSSYLTIQWAKRQQLFEVNDSRKIHKEKVSSLGGLPIFLTLWPIVFVFSSSFKQLIPLFLASTILMLVGLWDDLQNIAIAKRLLAQMIAASLAFFAGFNFGLEGSLIYISADYFATVLLIILIINGVNFIDGINGLAGGMGIISIGVFGHFFYASGLAVLSLFALIYLAAIFGFLIFNFRKKAAIFMGDNGSTVLGFITAIFALKSYQLLPAGEYHYMLPIIITLIAIPIMDLLAVVLIRIAKGQSPFKADRIHIHHLLTDNGLSHSEACQFIFLWLLGLISLFYFAIIISIFTASYLIVGSYLLVRARYAIMSKSTLISPVKEDKPAPKPSQFA